MLSNSNSNSIISLQCWSGWPDRILRPWMVTHPSTNWARHRAKTKCQTTNNMVEVAAIMTAGHQYILCDKQSAEIKVSTSGSRMKRSPQLTITWVDISSIVEQQLHHITLTIYATLKTHSHIGRQHYRHTFLYSKASPHIWVCLVHKATDLLLTTSKYFIIVLHKKLSFNCLLIWPSNLSCDHAATDRTWLNSTGQLSDHCVSVTQLSPVRPCNHCKNSTRQKVAIFLSVIKELHNWQNLWSWDK